MAVRRLAGVSAVVNLALDGVSRSALTKYGACRAIVTALHTHGERMFELKRVCVEAILNLLSDDQNSVALKAAGAPAALLLVVSNSSSTAGTGSPERPADVCRRERRMMARAWTSLARLTSAEPRPASDADQQLHLENADDLPSLLRQYDAAGIVVASALEAARIIFERNGSKPGLNKDDEDEEDNAVVIIDEVEIASSSQPSPARTDSRGSSAAEFDDDGRGASALLSALCLVMQAFATLPTPKGTPAFSDTLLDAGAAPMLERTLRCALKNSQSARRCFSHSAILEADDLARRACAAIMALAAASSRARLLLGDAGVCEAAVVIARDICGRYSDLPREDMGRLRYYAVGAVSNLAFSAPYNKERLDNAGALQAVAACAEAASDDLEQQRLCCRAFCTLGIGDPAEDKDGHRQLEDKHLAVVTQAMLSYNDTQLHHLGCAAIINLAAEARHRRALGRVNACEAVTAALKAHPMDARVQEYGFRAAVYLARDDPENRERFHAHGVRRLGASAANLFAGNPSVLVWAQRLQKEL